MKKGKNWSTGIFIFYVAFMILLLAVVIYSTNNNVELVTKNYYEKTLNYEKRIQAIKNTRSLAEKPLVSIEKDQQQILLIMPKEFAANTIQGKIYFFRPSLEQMDFSVALKCDFQNQQAFPLQELASGKWKIQLSWTDGFKEFYFEQVIFI